MLFPKQGTKNTLKLQNPAAAELNHKPFCPKVIFRSQPDHSYIPIHIFLSSIAPAIRTISPSCSCFVQILANCIYLISITITSIHLGLTSANCHIVHHSSAQKMNVLSLGACKMPT